MRIVDTSEMKEIENLAKEKFHYDGHLMTENVGIQGARLIQDRILNEISDGELIFLIGKGNNGADGLAIARHLTTLGHRVRAFKLFSDEDCSEELKKQLVMAKAFGVSINLIENAEHLEGYFSQMGGNAIVVDAIYGMGVNLPLSNFLYDIINYINENSSYTISVDIPSGIEGDTGFMQGNAINANMTLAVGLPKLGHYVADGAKLVGDIHILDIGLPQKLLEEGNKYLLGLENIIDPINSRDQFADKKVFGHTLVIGGSHGLTGALVMASQAALKVGAGLITAATWEPQYHEFISRLIPEIMTGYVPLDTNKWSRIIKDLNKYSAIVIGPGLAKSTRARKLVLEILHNFDGPVVIDADAINVLNLKEDKGVFQVRNAPTVLTPHFGEFSKFSGVAIEDLKRKPVKHLQDLVEQINCTVILKGPCTYLGMSDGTVHFNFFPNDGMATGGVGDVLAGILGGLLGQEPELKENKPLNDRYEKFNKTIGLSVLLHSFAGHFAAKEFGVRTMSATSIIDSFPKAFKELGNRINQLLES